MPTQQERQEIIDLLTPCGGLSYQSFVNLLYSIPFLNELGVGSMDVFVSRFTGEWSASLAAKGKYDIDYYVVNNNNIYKSTVNNNKSIPGLNSDWFNVGGVTGSVGFKGLALPDTNPGVLTENAFYIAGPGTYDNFKDVNMQPLVVGEVDERGNPNLLTVFSYNTTDGFFSKTSYSLQFPITIENIVNLSEKLNAIFNSLPVNYTLIDLPAFQDGYYRTDATQSGDQHAGDFVSYSPYKSLSFDLSIFNQRQIFVTGSIVDAGTALVFYYDENHIFISFEYRGLPQRVTYNKVKLNVPQNARFLNLTFEDDGVNPLVYSGEYATDILTQSMADQLYQPLSGDSSYRRPGLEIWHPKQYKYTFDNSAGACFYGTSRVSTDYPWLKQEFDRITGGNCFMGGFSGYTMSQLAQDAQLGRIFGGDRTLVIVEGGANDTGEQGSVGTFGAIEGEPLVSETDITQDYNGTYFIQAISHMMRKFRAHYENIRERANLNGNESEAEKTSKIDGVLKPYFVYLTPIGEKRANSAAHSNPENWQRKRDAFVECANKYHEHLIDEYNLFKINWGIEPSWPGVTNTQTNFGVYTMDGLHMNKWGDYQRAHIICGGLGII